MNGYVALLRGINVGGNNLIRMPALKACFEAERLRDVATYIQSGNVLFAADRSSHMTIRNWNTTRKLLQLMEGMRVGNR